MNTPSLPPASPLRLDLKQGVPLTFQRAGQSHEVQLLNVQEHWEPDFWVDDNENRQTLSCAEIHLKLDGSNLVLYSKPFEPLTRMNSLRLGVEVIRASSGGLHPFENFQADVRISVATCEEPLFPGTLCFPLKGWRHGASSYRNTWGALVPYNKLYYHRGEDFGAAPDLLQVVAPVSGQIVKSPLPRGDNGSNRLSIQYAPGCIATLSHMNIRSIDPRLQVGTVVKAGEPLARSGCTWSGEERMWHDPHLHLSFEEQGQEVNYFDAIKTALLWESGEPGIVQAGGYRFALPEQEVELDATSTLLAPGRSVQRVEWRRPGQAPLPATTEQISFTEPGQYAVELRLFLDNQTELRDITHIRVWQPGTAPQSDRAHGFLHAYPMAEIHAGDTVKFYPRWLDTKPQTTLNFGDGSPEKTYSMAEANQGLPHRYSAAGWYTITSRTTSQQGQPLESAVVIKISP